MSILWRRIVIKAALPLSWRLFSGRRGTILSRFSIAEADSAWHFLDALSHVDQASIRAKLFNNALEEVRHAELFEQAAIEYANTPIHNSIEERVSIYNPQKGLQHFYAYVYVGEKDVYEQFETYAGAISSISVSNIFFRLKKDEDGHMQFAEQRLVTMDLNRHTILKEIRTIRRKRQLEFWGRSLRWITDLILSFLLGMLYFFLGILGSSVFGSVKDLNDEVVQ